QRKGAHVALATIGSGYELVSPSRFRINPAKPEMFDRVYREARPSQDAEWTGVVFLWSADDSNDSGAETINDPQERGSRRVLNLVHTLCKARSKTSPRLYLVTRNTQPAGPDDTFLDPTQSPLWGLGRVIALEQPELRTVRIDLEAATSDEDNIRQ